MICGTPGCLVDRAKKEAREESYRTSTGAKAWEEIAKARTDRGAVADANISADMAVRLELLGLAIMVLTA